MVDGTLYSGAALAGPLILGGAVLMLLLVVLAAMMTGREGLQRWLYALAGSLSLALTSALLVQGGAMLGDGGAPRVSPAWGFWGLPAAAWILLHRAGIPRGRGRRTLLVLLMILPSVLILAGGRGGPVSVFREFQSRPERFLAETLVHLRLFSTAVLAATVIGVPLGVLASRNRRFAGPVISFVDGVQTIPSMALFGLLIAPLAALARNFPFLKTLGISGVGAAPALIALTLYALLPVVRNTVAGLAAVPESTLEAGRGMGMSNRQLFRRVRRPMALPYLLAGLRTASVQAVGNTAVAALIGAGGLGIMIFQGLGQAAPDLILLGVLPLIIMAFAVDRIWDYIVRIAVSPGLRAGSADQAVKEKAA